MKVKRGTLYLANLNPPRGTEAGKLRPVVVIQSDLLNEAGHPSTWILPCTTQLTPDNILRVRLPPGCAGNHKECDVMVDQSRTIDNRRLEKSLGPIPQPLLAEVEEKLRLIGSL